MAANLKPKTRLAEVRRSLKETGPVGRNVFVEIDDMYTTIVVYAYCGYDRLKEILQRLYGKAPSVTDACGYCFYGDYVGGYAQAAVVWINSGAVAKKDAIPTLMHEISHLADYTLEGSKVEDKNGEARAYLVGRETRRALTRMFGMKFDDLAKPADVERLIAPK